MLAQARQSVGRQSNKTFDGEAARDIARVFVESAIFVNHHDAGKRPNALVAHAIRRGEIAAEFDIGLGKIHVVAVDFDGAIARVRGLRNFFTRDNLRQSALFDQQMRRRHAAGDGSQARQKIAATEFVGLILDGEPFDLREIGFHVATFRGYLKAMLALLSDELRARANA